ncbi:MAG TPA: hypothetical protein VFC79_03715 [Tissierellaceae bacterium]|uniref:cell wall-binding protein n=1 Tax=uncultured Clostridium sp. TaxID=59620 RepID=UPI0025D5761C|nr:cell wall-binding protein [uncultured Clostridium sp.]HZJ99084.1 hypothetical protein [Tissierellaceae bacterium]
MKRIERFIASIMIMTACTVCIPAYAWTSELNGWINGTKGWSYMINGIYLDGWQKIDGKWYYFYKDTNFMAHDTIIEGYYINSSGVWTQNIPYGISMIMKNDMNYIDSILRCTAWSFYTEENINFKDLCNGNWNVPDIIGNVYWIQDEEIDIMGYFVSCDNVYSLGNQGGMDIYKIEGGRVVQRIPYNYGESYIWRC